MKKPFLLALLLLLGHLSWGQIKGTVTDQATGKPVPYVNIWVENENLGTTANEKGQFSFGTSAAVGKMLVVSSLGYERTRVPITAPPMKIRLVPTAVGLPEVVVQKSLKKQKLLINPLSRETSYSFGSSGTPWIVAQFIPFKTTYKATPYLDEIALVTLSSIKNAKFKIHLYQVTASGAPGKDLLPEPLYGLAPKGTHTVRLDVSAYDLLLPENGVFVAFEWLIIDQNRYEYPQETPSAQKPRFSYEPSLRSYEPWSKGHHGWIYAQGAWHDNKEREGEAITFATPHFQVTLSN